MGILIPNVNMPKGCALCQFLERRYQYDPDHNLSSPAKFKLFCHAKTKAGREITSMTALNNRARFCPLVEVGDE